MTALLESFDLTAILEHLKQLGLKTISKGGFCGKTHIFRLSKMCSAVSVISSRPPVSESSLTSMPLNALHSPEQLVLYLLKWIPILYQAHSMNEKDFRDGIR